MKRTFVYFSENSLCPSDIRDEIANLDDIVVNYATRTIIYRIQAQLNFIKTEKQFVPMPNSKYDSSIGTKTPMM